MYVSILRGRVRIPACSSSFVNAYHSPLRSSQMLLDVALKRAEAELSRRFYDLMEGTQWRVAGVQE